MTEKVRYKERVNDRTNTRNTEGTTCWPGAQGDRNNGGMMGCKMGNQPLGKNYSEKKTKRKATPWETTEERGQREQSWSSQSRKKNGKWKKKKNNTGGKKRKQGNKHHPECNSGRKGGNGRTSTQESRMVIINSRGGVTTPGGGKSPQAPEGAANNTKAKGGKAWGEKGAGTTGHLTGKSAKQGY